MALFYFRSIFQKLRAISLNLRVRSLRLFSTASKCLKFRTMRVARDVQYIHLHGPRTHEAGAGPSTASSRSPRTRMTNCVQITNFCEHNLKYRTVRAISLIFRVIALISIVLSLHLPKFRAISLKLRVSSLKLFSNASKCVKFQGIHCLRMQRCRIALHSLRAVSSCSGQSFVVAKIN